MTSNGLSQKLQNTGLCSIIKENSFVEELKLISKSNDRFLDFEDMIDWALSRAPEKFHSMEDNYYLWKTSELKDFPELLILYHFDKIKNQITLINIVKV